MNLEFSFSSWYLWFLATAMKTIFPFTIILSLLMFSCQKEFRGKKYHCKERCKGDEICTTDYRTLSLRVVDDLGNPVRLESFYTLQNRTGRTNVGDDNFCSTPYWEGSEEGYYPYWSDAQAKKTLQEGEEVTFIGMKDGKEVVRKPLKVWYDCCHVVPGEDHPVVKVFNPKP